MVQKQRGHDMLGLGNKIDFTAERNKKNIVSLVLELPQKFLLARLRL